MNDIGCKRGAFSLTLAGQEGRQLDGYYRWCRPDRCTKGTGEGCGIDTAASSKACAEEEVKSDKLREKVDERRGCIIGMLYYCTIWDRPQKQWFTNSKQRARGGEQYQ